MAGKQLQFVRTLAGVLLISTAASAQSSGAFRSENPEDFRVEIMGSGWVLNSGGNIQSGNTPVDFVHDLNVGQGQPTFFGRLFFKPKRKQRIVVEGTPFHLQGFNTIDRTFVYQNRSFSVSDTVRSSADLNYFFAGYQYDVLTGSQGHLGLSVGGAYLGATGSILAVQTNTTGTRSEKIGLPLAGADFRIFPIPHHRIFEIEGDIRGMGLGSYGYYVEAMGSGGICLGPVSFLAGYRGVNTELHETSGRQDGITARLQGPIFSGVFRW